MTQKNATQWKFTATDLCARGVDTRTVMEARAQVEKDLKAGCQVKDPVTGRVAQVYDRGITRKMVEVMAVIYHLTRKNPDIYVDASSLKTRGGDYGKLRHWGLIEQGTDFKQGVLHTKPLWRITAKGISFIEDGIEIPKKVLVFNDRRVGYVDTKTVTFKSIMGGLDLAEILKRKGFV